jgi:hypothetical protein
MRAIKNITKLVVAGVMILLTACDPIEDRDELKNSFDPDNIELEVIQTADGTGNGLTLKMNTPGVIGWWDYLTDKKYTDECYVVFPIPGTHTFTYTVATPYFKNGDPGNREVITKSIEVTIDVLDQPLPQAYYNLVGEGLLEKTWVFDGGPSPDGRQWWFMSDPGNPWGIWWNAAGDCCPPEDAAGKMVFDLKGGANYTYYSSANGSAVTGGTFKFNANFSKLFISGPKNLLGAVPGSGGGNAGEYNIVELTPEKLVLHVPNGEWSTGWTWVFVPAQ